MQKFGTVLTSGRLLTVAALFGVALVALIAVPFVASADEGLEGKRDRHGPTTVEQCRDRVAAEDPRRDNFLDELVTDAVITAEQAAEIDARMDAHHFNGCVARILINRGIVIGSTAEITGTEPREVLGALVAGQSLSEYANSFGVDDVSLVSAIMQTPEAKAAELVANGEIGQEDVDNILQKIEERVGEIILNSDVSPPGDDAPFGEEDDSL